MNNSDIPKSLTVIITLICMIIIVSSLFAIDKKIVDEVAPIRPIKDENENKEFFGAKEGTMVYHTNNEEFVIRMRKDPSMKVIRI